MTKQKLFKPTATQSKLMGTLLAFALLYQKEGIKKLEYVSESSDGKFSYIFGGIRGAKTVPALVEKGFMKQISSSEYSITAQGMKFIAEYDKKGQYIRVSKAVHLTATMLDGELTLNETPVYIKAQTENLVSFHNPLTDKGSRINANEMGEIHKSDFSELSPKVKKTGFYASMYTLEKNLEKAKAAFIVELVEQLEEQKQAIESQVETLDELISSVPEASFELQVPNVEENTDDENSDDESPENEDNTNDGNLNVDVDAIINEENPDIQLPEGEEVINPEDDADLEEWRHLLS